MLSFFKKCMHSNPVGLNVNYYFAYWVILHAFLSSAEFFQNLLFRKNLGSAKNTILSPTNWTQIRPDILSGLIWVQTICKGYQRMTKITTIVALKELRTLYHVRVHTGLKST